MKSAAEELGANLSLEQGGGLELETSIENYKKLYGVIGKQVTQTKKLAAAEENVSVIMKAKEKVLKAESKLDANKAKSLKKNIKQYAKNEEKIKKLTEEEQDYVKALIHSEKVGKKKCKNIKIFC